LKVFRFYTALILILAFSVGLGYQTFTVGYFYWNRAEIAAEHCVNKDKPQLNCHGKCHLQKQLTGENKVSETGIKSVPEPLTFWLFGIEILSPVKLLHPDFHTMHSYVCLEESTNPIQIDLFSPPDFA